MEKSMRLTFWPTLYIH